MRASLLKDTIARLWEIKRPVAVVGAPGGGKTQCIQQTAKEIGCHFIQRHLPTIPVEDFGVPDMSSSTDTTFKYKLPEWFPSKGSKYDDGKGGILLFDDRNQADNDLQKALANLIQEREVHGVPMADGWQVISTGNRKQDRAGANKVLGHLANRETELELETHLDDWRRHALDNGARTEVVSFIGFRPNLLHDYDPQREGGNPTPRSWMEGVSAVLGVVSSEAEYECFKGAIGEGAAAEFVGFMRIFRKLPNPDNTLLNPKTADVPEDAATLYALSGALASRATPKNMGNLCLYLERLPAEFSVLCVSTVLRRDPECADTEAFRDWSIGNQSVLF